MGFPPYSGAADVSAAELVQRIRQGDRAAAAEFIHRHQPLLRRRYRHKFNAAMRRLSDSEDLISTLTRRLDAYVVSGRLRAATPDELFALLHQIVQTSMADKGRVLSQLQQTEAEDGSFAVAMAQRLLQGHHHADAGLEQAEWLQSVIGLLENPVDQEIVTLWTSGVPLMEIASRLDMSPENVRKRWERIKKHLRKHLEAA